MGPPSCTVIGLHYESLVCCYVKWRHCWTCDSNGAIQGVISLRPGHNTDYGIAQSYHRLGGADKEKRSVSYRPLWLHVKQKTWAEPQLVSAASFSRQMSFRCKIETFFLLLSIALAFRGETEEQDRRVATAGVTLRKVMCSIPPIASAFDRYLWIIRKYEDWRWRLGNVLHGLSSS